LKTRNPGLERVPGFFVLWLRADEIQQSALINWSAGRLA